MNNAPLWLRVAIYAAQHQDTAGTVFLEPGELRDAMGVEYASHITRAVAAAVHYGWLRPGSTARMLWVSDTIRQMLIPPMPGGVR